MARIKHNVEHLDYLEIACPGCKRIHLVPYQNNQPSWQWDGKLDFPTLRPSVRVSWYHKDGEEREEYVCHFFITNGNIEFCGDCFHDLSGKTVPLAELPPASV